MTTPTKDELRQVKTVTAALMACIVRTLEKSDPSFDERFLETLSEAYYHFRDDHGGEVIAI